ncbi:MAG: bactofilin family protein [bacterium]
MRRISVSVARFSVVGAVFLLLASASMALVIRGGNRVTIPPGEILGDDLYAAGGSLDLRGDFRGDVVVAGGTIALDGPVSEDLIAAGGTVRIDGDIGDDIRAAGGTVEVRGNAGGDLVAAGGNIILMGRISQDAQLSGGTVDIEGEIGRNLNASGGNITLSGTVRGNADLRAGERISIAPTAKILGDLTYTSPAEATIGEGAQILGKITHLVPEGIGAREARRAPKISKFVFLILKLVGLIIVGIILIAAFPRGTLTLAGSIGSNPWKSLSLGFAVLVCTPIAILISLATIIGIPLGIVLLFVYLMALYFSAAYVSVFLADRALSLVIRGGMTPRGLLILATVVMIVVLTLLGYIPYAGWAIRLAYVIFGLGAIVVGTVGIYLESRKQGIF